MLILFLLEILGKLAFIIWSGNVSIMQGEDTNAIIREMFRSFLHNYQQELQIIKGSERLCI